MVEIFEKPISSYFYVFCVQDKGMRFLRRLVSHTY